jgi:glycolate oxidase FAD binding subunit
MMSPMTISTTLYEPANEADVSAIVLEARAKNRPLAIVGGGTRGIGRPTNTAETLSMRGVKGITLYEPAEMVISARAGTPLAEVKAALAAKGQMLAFEPMDHRMLLGTAGEPTIGAIAAGNISGPRRIHSGAARDSLIGVRFVNGRGEAIKNGGRVMKNVTGLDLVKLMAGSWGTLGVLTEVTFKVSPVPETAASLVFKGLSDHAAVDLLSRALGSPFEITGAAHLPAGLGRDISRTVLRLEGFRVSVDYRLNALRKLFSAQGASSLLEGSDSARLWEGIGNVEFLAEPRQQTVWRLAIAPSKAAGVVETARKARAVRAFYDWGGGLVWLATDAEGDAGADAIHTAVGAAGGHATLIRGDEALCARLDVFQPLIGPKRVLTEGIKKSFDPDRVLNPGRMYAGI